MLENKNYLLAILLSMAVLVGWQVFVVGPRSEAERTRQAQIESQTTATSPGMAGAPGTGAPTTGAPTPGTATPDVQAPPASPIQAPAANRETTLGAAPRVAIDTPSLRGSINLRGALIDDLVLKGYRETVSRNSENVVLFSPMGAPQPYYAEHGFVPAQGSAIPVPGAETEWTASGDQLTAEQPLVLTWDNGQGLIFRRTISVDTESMFTVRQDVENTGTAPVTLHPYGLISRHDTPTTTGNYILHEGMIGVLGETGLEEVDYDDILESGTVPYTATSGWLGITDKYWASALIPDQEATYQARFTGTQNGAVPTFQADYLLAPLTIEAGQTAGVTGRVFAGAKQVSVIDSYEDALGIARFDLLIDWGWFYFITKPLFYALDYFYHLVGNFGVSILIVTVLIKLVFFPLAYKSYVSMSKMKLVQPEMVKIRDRFPDDRARQQQELMALYKKEKINPVSGCLPILVQIPVFFALYKVLFVTIEMRHAPFFGWIQDLSAPDPTSIFNLFGLIPWDPPSFLMLGVWPILMGITMWIQMRLNPTPPDPIQAMVFNWMPVLFTFMLASFPAGLVIYWAWNNFLSIVQQWTIMRRQGVKVDLLGNIRTTFSRQPKKSESSS